MSNRDDGGIGIFSTVLFALIIGGAVLLCIHYLDKNTAILDFPGNENQVAEQSANTFFHSRGYSFKNCLPANKQTDTAKCFGSLENIKTGEVYTYVIWCSTTKEKYCTKSLKSKDNIL